MNQDNGRLNFVATVDTSQTKKDADELVRIFQSIGKSAERYGIDIDKYIGGGLRNSNDAQRAFKGIAEELKAKIAKLEKENAFMRNELNMLDN